MEILISIFLVIALVSFSLSLVFYNIGCGLIVWNCKKNNLPPSPPSLPILGHCHLLNQPIHRSLAALAKRYGPILYLHFGCRPVLLVSSSSAAEECLSTNDIVFANRPRLTVGKYLGYNHTSMLFASYGPHWRNLRRISTIEIFSQHRIHMFSATQKQEIRSLVKRLFQRGLGQEGRSVVVELKSEFSELMFNVILGTITGKQYHGEKTMDVEEAMLLRKLIRESMSLLDVSNYLDFFPGLGWMDFGRIKKRMVKVMHEGDELVQRLIDDQERRSKKDDVFCDSEEGESGKKMTKTLIDILLSLKKTEAEYYTDDIIKGLILVLFS